MKKIETLQDFILQVIYFWTQQGCIWSQPYDAPMGAGTFHPHTFIKGIGHKPWKSIYVQPCRRPVDGRYGESPYRFQHYYQIQVLLKPAPHNIVDLFIYSLDFLGIDLKKNDICLLEDNWEGPTLGAWGLGWEVRANGQEVTQFTYFQQLGGQNLDVISGEITYGAERLFMYLNGYKNGLDIPYNKEFTYGDIFKQNEFEQSHFNFTHANTSELTYDFDKCEETVRRLCELDLVLPAYDHVLRASHSFNLLDARGALSVSERQRYIGRVRDCAKMCAEIIKKHDLNLNQPKAEALVAREDKKPETVNISSETSEVAIEIGVEELPPSFMKALHDQLEMFSQQWLSTLKDKHLADSEFSKTLKSCSLKTFVSPRRISLTAKNLPSREPDLKKIVWGPAQRIAQNSDGTLSQAALGFLKKNNLNQEQVSFKERSDLNQPGVFLHAEVTESGAVLPQKLADDFLAFTLAVGTGFKQMRWLPENTSPSFVRPVRSILALVNDQIIPVKQFGISSSHLTFGHRILSPEAIKINHAKDYLIELKNRGITLDWTERLSKIQAQANELAASVGGVLIKDSALLEKLAGLSEMPEVFLGRIETKYLELPKKLIVGVLREQMNYLAIEDENQNILGYYIGVATYPCLDRQGMIRGTEDVVVGRLDDGNFYYSTDLKTPIQAFKEKLKHQVFQAGLGSLHDKSERVGQLAQALCRSRKHLHILCEDAFVAGLHAKADLKSGSVQEFPDDLQGVMGGILVKHQKPFGDASTRIADAISEHYQPMGAHDTLPKTQLGRILSLADKLDSLVLLINHNTDVSGNKDPFGLRRLALGALRIMGLDNPGLDFSISETLELTIENLRNMGIQIQSETKTKVIQFLLNRLKASWKLRFAPDAFEAIVNERYLDISLTEIAEKIETISKHSQDTEFKSLMHSYKRLKNICGQGNLTPSEFNIHVYHNEHELNLATHFLTIKSKITSSKDSLKEQIFALYQLKNPLEVFFENIMVNDPDHMIKQHRIALLNHIKNLFDEIADFSKIQVAG